MTTRTPPSGWLSRLAQGSLVKQILIGLVLGVLLAQLLVKPVMVRRRLQRQQQLLLVPRGRAARR